MKTFAVSIRSRKELIDILKTNGSFSIDNESKVLNMQFEIIDEYMTYGKCYDEVD